MYSEILDLGLEVVITKVTFSKDEVISYICMHVYGKIHTHTHIFMHACMHACMHAYMYMDGSR